jgi:hypothetical protein
MSTWVLWPGWQFDDELSVERAALENAFDARCSFLLSDIPSGSLVIPRYRAIPFGRELQAEVTHMGSRLINTYDQHRFAADLGQWYESLADLTAQSWPAAEHISPGENGPFFVKGETNSRRQLWNTHCYAPNRQALGAVIANLNSDSLIGHQRLWIRKFESLRVLGTDISGMPLNEEYRVFFLDGQEMARGFYWVNHEEHLGDFVPTPDEINPELLNTVGQRIKDHIRFAAVDVARRADGTWCVIEVNDGSQSGICGVDPTTLWTNVSTQLQTP